ncbi:DUF4239 domain-containing protein [Ruegeria sp. 2205SS24-7]|uniref:bestrophin-like domain n=1 Tax=Ruegeria discodermiae TaxID=3064389 RepID=UPI002740B616|nr:DUF4239 domain-containing protein [Ruegeria sp. 2205SS24-7]MDP5216528.1 DUF4239 domain-containing protein [Ruegeria sp. 2205SS24-7]
MSEQESGQALDWMLYHPWASIALIILVMSAISVLPYYFIHRFRQRPPSDATREMAVNIGFRIGTLHALILALIFSGAQEQYEQARETIAAEVIILSEAAHEIARLRNQDIDPVRAKFFEYIDVLEQDDTPAMDVHNIGNSDLIFREASQVSSEIYQALLAIEPEEEQQSITLDRIVSKLDQAFSLRLERVAATARGVSNLFWTLSVVGYVFLLLVFFVTPFSWIRSGLVALYSIYTGLTLFFIIEMSNPYLGLSSIDLSNLSAAFDTIETQVE